MSSDVKLLSVRWPRCIHMMSCVWLRTGEGDVDRISVCMVIEDTGMEFTEGKCVEIEE